MERADDLRARRGRRGPRALSGRDGIEGHREESSVLLGAARECAGFLLDDLRDDRGRLLRSYNDGRAKLDAYLEDHAFLLEALLTLYEATFEARWFAEARALADTMIERFADPERGGFFSTASDHEPLIARRKDLEDAPIPSGASSAAFGLLRLAALTGEHEYERHAVSELRLLHEIAPRHPTAFGHLLQALDFQLSPVREVALVGADVSSLARVVREALRPPPRAGGGTGTRFERRAAAGGANAGGPPPGRLRVRALCLPAPGHRARRARPGPGRIRARVTAIGAVAGTWQPAAIGRPRSAVLQSDRCLLAI